MGVFVSPTSPRASAGEHGIRLQLLGPLRVWRDGFELDPGPRQQAVLLALLLARAGLPVGMGDLVDFIWEESPPASAANTVRKYVGGLRRILEPDLGVRQAGSYLRRRGGAYRFIADSRVLDMLDFRERVFRAATAVADGDVDSGLDSYVAALGLWQGATANALGVGSIAQSVFSALDDEFFTVCATAADLAVPLDRAGEVLRPLSLAASMAPLHEPVHAALVSALSAAGKPAQALGVFSALRRRLSEELGIEPSAQVQAAHRQALGGGSLIPAQVASRERYTAECTSARLPSVPRSSAAVHGQLVGRADEMEMVRRAIEAGRLGGARLIIVEGEPGVGKTRLVESAAADATAQGMVVVWGRCLQGDGAPPLSPWVEALQSLLVEVPPTVRSTSVHGDLGRLLDPNVEAVDVASLPDSGAQHRLFQHIVALIREAAAINPVVLVLDDLHWADAASLHLLEFLARRSPSGVTVIGTLRDQAPLPHPGVVAVLAAVSRLVTHRRISLGPLGIAEVTEIVRRETGRSPENGVARSMHSRTSGNPFFVKELSRLLAGGGPLTVETMAAAGVPTTVRDVVRDRASGVGPETRDLLEIAAFIGRNVDLRLLARAAGRDTGVCLEQLAPLAALGLLEPVPAHPGAMRFAHDIVREAVAETVPPTRAPAMHLRVADAIQQLDRPHESAVESLAHHLWSAGPLADPTRTAHALLRAARRATARIALSAAERQSALAVDVARDAGLPEVELEGLSQLAGVVAMRTGFVASSPDLLKRGEDLARSLGREMETVDFLFARWTAHAHHTQLDRSGPAARRLLELGEKSVDPVTRACGLHAWGTHQWALGNIGQAYQYLSRLDGTLDDADPRVPEGGLRRDRRLRSPVKLAEVTALHGDLDASRTLLDRVEAAAADDPYAITTWATWASKIAAMAGDPAWALQAAERGKAVDPEFTFTFLGTYIRLHECWALAMRSTDPAAPLGMARDLVAGLPLDPPRCGITTVYELLGEIFLVAGELTDAAAALEAAEMLGKTRGERPTEGLSLLLKARLLEARGDRLAAVRVADFAQRLCRRRGAHLFAHRAEELLIRLGESAEVQPVP